MKKTPPIIHTEEDSPRVTTQIHVLDKFGLPDTRPAAAAPTVVFEDIEARLSRGFTQVPNAILRDPGLSGNDKAAYGLLLSYAWQRHFCYPALETLAGDMGLTSSAVSRVVKRLVVARLVKIQRRGQGLSNIYHIRRLSDRYKSIVDKGSGG